MNSALPQLDYVGIVVAYLLLVNVWEFALFAWDKQRARNGDWRVSESALLSVALIGGSLGAMIGQKVLRHKTRKQPFRSQLLVIVVIQAVAIFLVSAYGVSGALVLLGG